MLLNPAIMSLVLTSVLSCATVLAVVPFSIRLLRNWQCGSGSEVQIALERRDVLVTALLRLVMLAAAGRIVLFVIAVDRLAGSFGGVICAIGTLEANAFGFPALGLHILVFFLAAGWLGLQHVDTRGWDEPLIRVKYAALLGLAPVLLADTLVEFAYFAGLHTDIVATCCHALFGGEDGDFASSLASLPPAPALALLGGALGLTLASGLLTLWRERFGVWHAVFAVAAFPVAIEAIISTLSVYVYELPQHHCPFCLLKAEYGYIGYALYLPLFAAVASAISGAITSEARKIPSLTQDAPRMARRLAGISVAGFGIFTVLSLTVIVRSPLLLFNG
jgi:hypothetical protein